MAYFKPDRYFSRLSQISIEKDILGCGFENVLLDIDNTFVPRDTQVIPRDARVWLGCARGGCDDLFAVQQLAQGCIRLR